MKRANIDIELLKSRYSECSNLHKLAKEFHTSHIRLSNILKDNGICINSVGKKKLISDNVVSNIINDYSVLCEKVDTISKKYGIGVKLVSKILKDNNINVSRWFGHVKPIKKTKEIKKKYDGPYKYCPYCEWKTKDVDNKSNAYMKHLKYVHHINIDEHLQLYPEDECLLNALIKEKSMIPCPVCGELHYIIDDRHLKKHGMTKSDLINVKNDVKLISDGTVKKLRQNIQKMNDNPNWDRKTSSYEDEIVSFLKDNNIEYIQHDRKILDGLELDIYIPSKQIAIEINGNKFHTEWFGGKGMNYHLNKTLGCLKKGIRLIQIFEDEIKLKHEIVFNKLQRILGLCYDFKRLYARKCCIREISVFEASRFMDSYHIQGFVSSSIYLGCYYNNLLVGVMTFKRCSNNSWDLNRFATHNDYVCCGVGSKLFNYFVKNYRPNEIKSFADRRWTLDYSNNLYIKLGFTFERNVDPSYCYYNEHINKFVRFHKFSFRKKKLISKYGFDKSMTESEIMKHLGYDRIWDCGLFKYVWKNKNINDE